MKLKYLISQNYPGGKLKAPKLARFLGIFAPWERISVVRKSWSWLQAVLGSAEVPVQGVSYLASLKLRFLYVKWETNHFRGVCQGESEVRVSCNGSALWMWSPVTTKAGHPGKEHPQNWNVADYISGMPMETCPESEIMQVVLHFTADFRAVVLWAAGSAVSSCVPQSRLLNIPEFRQADWYCISSLRCDCCKSELFYFTWRAR